MCYYPVGEKLPSNLAGIFKMATVIQEKHYEELGLVCTGSSGSIIAAIIASQLDPVPRIYYIRKKYERNHGHSFYNLTNMKNLVVVDDFTASGDTVKHMIDHLKKVGIQKANAICMLSSETICSASIMDFFDEQLFKKTADGIISI